MTLFLDIPDIFNSFILYDSGEVENRIILTGDGYLMYGLAHAKVWKVDGALKTVPEIYFQI